MMLSLFRGIRPVSCLLAFLSSAILSFGLYHIHSLSGVTEGGILGLTLLLEHWFAISPSVTNFVASSLCYLLGWRLLGRRFIIYSAVATVGFSLSYEFFACFDPLWPELAEKPLLAAVLGAIFVGLGAGVCVRVGGAVNGDDALAMCISSLARMDIQWAYLICDAIVLGLSLSYIPLERIGYSFLTVIISGQLVGFVQRVSFVRRLGRTKRAIDRPENDAV